MIDKETKKKLIVLAATNPFSYTEIEGWYKSLKSIEDTTKVVDLSAKTGIPVHLFMEGIRKLRK